MGLGLRVNVVYSRRNYEFGHVGDSVLLIKSNLQNEYIMFETLIQNV
jgi:hypothetical protein